MELLLVSFIAGVLTVLAPCILPLLPVIVGGSVLHGGKSQASIKQPMVIVSSLALSIIVFTLLLKVTTLLLGVPTSVWSVIAGGIVLLFGINLLFPSLWEKIMISTGLEVQASRFMGSSQQNKGIKKDILLGASLGPVFNSCSPTYALIIAVILPASFTTGLAYLAAYAIGVATILLLISLAGQGIVQRMRWLSNPEGVFKKVIAILFILVGIAVITGLDKQVQAYVLQNGWYDPIMKIEESFKEG
jgi:cytochrome c-type biogenesis protein